jgi:hypothetical protein
VARPQEGGEGGALLRFGRAFEIGQLTFAPAATSWNLASSIPGTSASVTSWIFWMPKPSPTLPKWTCACVDTLVGSKPALPKPAESAIEKHPAWAAPMSSSGLVPGLSSNRVENE